MIGYGITLIILSVVVLLTVIKNNKLERRLVKTENEVDELIERLIFTDDKMEKHINEPHLYGGIDFGREPIVNNILLCDEPIKPEVSG
ncbi:hypothetical protein [Listeria newyorkensis]|uniref:Uncharacterized protein n=1 Tax=Listeria newyorkensis TaxID=1497681 RepID=A0A841Z0T0_9LIST|nr:hypothetical protein [Listeria newyorkensis]MBC1458463.1 hypothetical protein [Listeria newyorkensis]